MQFNSPDIMKREKIAIYLINLTVLFFLYRTSIPFFKYPFLLLFTCLVLLSLLFYRSHILNGFKDFIRKYYLLLILAFLYFVAAINTDKLYLTIAKDSVNIIILLTFLFILNLAVNKKKELVFLISNFNNLVIVFALLISISRLFSSLNLFSLEKLLFGYGQVETQINLAKIDYNFALLPIFFGIISTFYRLKIEISTVRKIFFNLLMTIFTLQILFSGSRRGLIVLFIILLLSVLLQIPFFFNRKSDFRRFVPNPLVFIISIIFLLFSFYLFVFSTSYQFKLKTLNFFGINDVYSAKEKISFSVYRYVSAFSKNISYSYLDSLIWTPSFNPEDPDSGWGENWHKTVFPLEGNNVEIVPKKSKGYLIDNSSFTYTKDGYAYSNTTIWNQEIEDDDLIDASVYCYVSEEFNGNVVQISSGGAAYGYQTDLYNMKMKGSWQKLSLKARSNKGEASVNLIFSKSGVTDLSALSGYVIFAHPEIQVKKYIFNPFDPDSGWGSRIHRTVTDLDGKNISIVPKYVKGYLLDSTCNASYYAGLDLCEAYSLLENIEVKNGDRYISSVFCFVSDDFDGSRPSILVGYESVNKGIVSGKTGAFYDMTKKGSWQKLEIDFMCGDGTIPIYLSFVKSGVIDFSKLKGYVIFAYPQIDKINNQDNSLSDIKRYPNRKYGFAYPSLSNIEYGIIKHNTPVINHRAKSKTDTNIHLNKFPENGKKYISAGFFQFSISSFYSPDSLQNDFDPIRNWVSKIVSEDTTYFPYKTNILLDTISNSFIAERILRWQFAIKIFANEYNWNEKIIGGGFDFLNWYGYYFYKDKSRSDYPHNPFLYILLYSGIAGMVVYLILLYKVFYFYLIYLKYIYLPFIFFLITFFFTFFSGGNPFDPPVMGFFIILPFFVNAIHKKDKIPE